MRTLGYFCRYVPQELLEACGFKAVCFKPDFSSPQFSSLPVPFCALCKTFISWALNHRGFSGFVVPLACDASRRTYEILRTLSVPVFSFDVPALTGEIALRWLTENLNELARKLLAQSGRSFLEFTASLKQALGGTLRQQKAFLREWEERLRASDRIPLLLSGSHFAHVLLPLLEEKGFLVFPDLPENRLLLGEEPLLLTASPLEDLARFILRRLPCPRLSGPARRTALKRLCGALGLRGVVIVFSKFCDFQLYEIGLLGRSLSLPVLCLEHDTTPSFPQWETRLDAFREMILHG